MNEETHFLVAMDGECSLCNKSVQFVAKHLKEDSKVSFCSLGSDAGKILLEKTGLTPDALILYDGTEYLSGQNAAIKLATMLRFPWNLLSVFKILPIGIREWGYQKIAQHRHFFGKEEDSCSIPENMDIEIIESPDEFLEMYP
jgi:predicted DCC family thiol-disulfide oxidoreductase YuxK